MSMDSKFTLTSLRRSKKRPRQAWTIANVTAQIRPAALQAVAQTHGDYWSFASRRVSREILRLAVFL
jgi:hypothetical protein